LRNKTIIKPKGYPPRSRKNLPSMVSEFIRAQILKGELSPGDKLPTEHELSELHDVSRVVVREAVARLRHEGLAVSRQGLGVFVASPKDSKFLTVNTEELSQPEDYRQLYALRKILESGAARLAAVQRDNHDLTLMKEKIRAMKSEKAYKNSYVDADIGFHHAVATATKNTFIGLFSSFVDSKLKESISLALQSLDFELTVQISVAEHTEVYNQIKERNPEGAEKAMRVHLENSSKRLGL